MVVFESRTSPARKGDEIRHEAKEALRALSERNFNTDDTPMVFDRPTGLGYLGHSQPIFASADTFQGLIAQLLAFVAPHADVSSESTPWMRNETRLKPRIAQKLF